MPTYRSMRGIVFLLFVAALCSLAATASAAVTILSASGSYSVGVTNRRDRFGVVVIMDKNDPLSVVSIAKFPSNDATQCGIEGVKDGLTRTLVNNTLTITLSPARAIGYTFRVGCGNIIVGAETGSKTATVAVRDDGDNISSRSFQYTVTGPHALAKGGKKNENGARYLATSRTLEFQSFPVQLMLEASMNCKYSFFITNVAADGEVSCSLMRNGAALDVAVTYTAGESMQTVESTPGETFSGEDKLTLSCAPFQAPGPKASIALYVVEGEAPAKMTADTAVFVEAEADNVAAAFEVSALAPEPASYPTEYYAVQTGAVCADNFCSPAAARSAAAAFGAALIAAAALVVAM